MDPKLEAAAYTPPEVLATPLTPAFDEAIAEQTMIVAPPAEVVETIGGPVIVLESPRDTSGWLVARKDGIETFTRPGDDFGYVRARPDEEADLIVNFTRIPGMTSMRLVRSDESSTVRRAERKRRREERELRKRGYDV